MKERWGPETTGLWVDCMLSTQIKAENHLKQQWKRCGIAKIKKVVTLS